LSWLIVVGALVAVAMAVHLYEQRRSKRVLAERRAARERAEEGLRWFRLAREVRESWLADVETMTLDIERTGAAPFSEAPLAFRLVRADDGSWVAAPREGEGETDTDTELALRGPIAERLEAQYQRFQRRVAKPEAGK
jgi:hypothetical protein